MQSPLDFLGGSDGKESASHAETGILSLGPEDPVEKGIADYPFQYSCLENPRERGAWWFTVYGVTVVHGLQSIGGV